MIQLNQNAFRIRHSIHAGATGKHYMLQRADIPQLSTNLTKSRPSTLAGHKTLTSEIIRHINKNRKDA
jgi:hypothetical protein